MSDEEAPKTLEERVASLEADMKGVKSNTDELVFIFKNAKVGVTIILFLGHVAKYIGSIAVAGIAIWALWQGIKDGHPPTLQ